MVSLLADFAEKKEIYKERKDAELGVPNLGRRVLLDRVC